MHHLTAAIILSLFANTYGLGIQLPGSAQTQSGPISFQQCLSTSGIQGSCLYGIHITLCPLFFSNSRFENGNCPANSYCCVGSQALQVTSSINTNLLFPYTVGGNGLTGVGVPGVGIPGVGIPGVGIPGVGIPGIPGVPGIVTDGSDVCGLPGTGVGVPSTTQFARMLGGQQVTSNQFCWTCAVFDKTTNTYIGGAAIVHRQFCVTSASIFNGRLGNSIIIRCGITNAQAGPTAGPCGQFRDVALVRFAPNFNENDQYYKNNLAIMKLAQPLDMSQKCVCKICLPGPTSSYVGQKCLASGYGITRKGGSYPGALYSIPVEVINEPECNRAYQQVVAGFTFHNSYLCAGGQQQDVDACTGDGGSPLACVDTTGLYVLAGVVSSGFQCGILGVPGLYTNVKIFSSFIDTLVRAG